jgi:hypothetical protein
MALGEGGDHGAALPLIADQAKHAAAGGIVRSGEVPLLIPLAHPPLEGGSANPIPASRKG